MEIKRSELFGMISVVESIRQGFFGLPCLPHCSFGFPIVFCIPHCSLGFLIDASVIGFLILSWHYLLYLVGDPLFSLAFSCFYVPVIGTVCLAYLSVSAKSCNSG